MFSRIEEARAVMESAERVAPNKAFIFQQHAILEYTHPHGSLELANKLAEQARNVDPNNHIYIHTLAEVARRRALQEGTQVRKDQLRAHARALLAEIWLRNAWKDSTYCKLLVDETLEMASDISDTNQDYEILDFESKLEETVNRLRKAQQDFPDEAEFGATEATLWKGLGENAYAERALQRAIKAKPRSASVYIRLGRLRAQRDDVASALESLKAGLLQFPDDRGLHLELALALIANQRQPSDEIEGHFRSSFAVGDHNFDARFYYGEYLFWNNRTEEASQLFSDLNKKAPESYRKTLPRSDDVIVECLGSYVGTIASRKERVFFVKSGSYPTSIFGHKTSLRDSAYEDLEIGHSVNFRIRFNRQGPIVSECRVR